MNLIEFLAPAVLVGESVSQWVSESVTNFLCLNDQAYNCLIHTTRSGIEQVCWHECRHCSRLLSGDDWQESFGTRRESALQSLALRLRAIPHSGLKLNKTLSKWFCLLSQTLNITIFFSTDFLIQFFLIEDEKGTPLTIHFIDLILACWTYSPSRGLCELFLMMLGHFDMVSSKV